MRSLTYFLLLFSTFSLNAQKASFWVAQKTDSTWMLFDTSDSLNPGIRVDSVVIISGAPLQGLGYVTITNGKYGVFLNEKGRYSGFGQEYDSIFVHRIGVFFLKNDSWSYAKLQEALTAGDSLPEMLPIGQVDSFFLNKNEVYYWNDGLQGLVNEDDHISPKYKFVRNISRGYDNSSYLVSDGKKVGLFSFGQELIPIQYEAVEAYQFGWYRFWVHLNDSTEYWDYLSPDNRIVQTVGNDFRVYSESHYKLYNTDRTQSSFYYNHNELNYGYQDYFFLGDEFLAVRRRDSIGLIDFNGKVYFEPQFEQVEILDNHRLRVLINQHWYLTDFEGNVLSKTGFGTIQAFGDWNNTTDGLLKEQPTYLVKSLKGLGVINDTGTVIIPVNYSEISKYGNFFLGLNGTIVVYSLTGKRVSNKAYHRYGKSFNDFIIMQAGKGRFDLLSTEGKVNSQEFERFLEYDGAFKCYNRSGFELIVMNDSIPTHVEEIQRFNLDNTVEVDQLDSLITWNGLGEIGLSELEETQLNGYWNLRETSTAHSRKMNWIEVIGGTVGAKTMLGVKEHKARMVHIPFGPEMKAYYDGVRISPSTYSIGSVSMISCTGNFEISDTKSTWDDLVLYPDGSQHWYGSTTNTSGIDPSFAFDIDYCLSSGFALTTAKDVRYEVNSKSDLDLFSWWMGKNVFYNLHPTRESLEMMLDPTLKVIPLETEVELRSMTIEKRNRNFMLDNTTYKAFNSISMGQIGKRGYYTARRFDSDTLYWFQYQYDSSLIKEYSELEFMENSFVITKGIKTHYGLSHPEIPDYIFDPSDPTNKNNSFLHGRLLSIKNGVTSLSSVKGEILCSVNGTMEALENGLFYVKEMSDSYVIDRNGRKVAQLKAVKIRSNKSDGFLVETNDSIYWYSKDLVLLNSHESGQLSEVLERYWLISKVDSGIIYDARGNAVGMLAEDEVISSNGWIVKRIDGGYTYRFISSNQNLVFDKKSEETASLLFGNVKDNYVVYDTKGQQIVSKKRHLTSKKEKGNFTILYSKRAFLVLDETGNILHSGSEYKSVEELDGVLYLETSDTVLLLEKKTSVNTQPNKSQENNEWKLGAEEVVILPKKKGLAFFYGKLIVPPTYDDVFICNERFVVLQQGRDFFTYEIGVGFVRMPNLSR